MPKYILFGSILLRPLYSSHMDLQLLVRTLLGLQPAAKHKSRGGAAGAACWQDRVFWIRGFGFSHALSPKPKAPKH